MKLYTIARRRTIIERAKIVAASRDEAREVVKRGDLARMSNWYEDPEAEIDQCILWDQLSEEVR